MVKDDPFENYISNYISVKDLFICIDVNIYFND